MANIQEPRSSNGLYFDPGKCPDATLKAFNDFVIQFELRYNAMYPDPPKVSVDAAIQRWTLQNTTEARPDPKPSLLQYDQLVSDWKSKDKVSKFLGIFSSERLYQDWCMAKDAHIAEIANRQNPTWDTFLGALRDFYAPTQNCLKELQIL